MSTSDVVIPSTFLKKLFDASSPTASLVSSILQAANHLLVCAPAGNTFAILNNILPTSMDTARPAPRQSSDARNYNNQSLICDIILIVNN
ncbi:hypothetical protein ARMSODRAFT_1023463 [Armillaria solidipes]|uniref:Uncharacterized protein n=1 Tax=Armillaria solidipes TaxID=1076256 RepID=A0A2H3BLW7_9AGAR|nr:hypothetical protein ARMSODRAFT_1023463 [Armillaria solidipes]